MTTDELRAFALAMVSGREQIPNVTSSSTRTNLKRDAELGDAILALLAVIEAAKAMRYAGEQEREIFEAFDAALDELEGT